MVVARNKWEVGMAYVTPNFKTKKALKEAVSKKQEVGVWQSGPCGGPGPDERLAVEGPHFPEPHRWYATVQVENGYVVKVID